MSKENKGLAPPASQDRVTDERSREGASPPYGSVPTGAGDWTPGPWDAVSFKEGRGIGWAVIDDRHHNLARVYSQSASRIRGIAEANARLIAAAPEMARALVIARGQLEAIAEAESLGEQVDWPSVATAKRIINNALAKASRP